VKIGSKERERTQNRMVKLEIRRIKLVNERIKRENGKLKRGSLMIKWGIKGLKRAKRDQVDEKQIDLKTEKEE